MSRTVGSCDWSALVMVTVVVVWSVGGCPAVTDGGGYVFPTGYFDCASYVPDERCVVGLV